MITFFVPGNPIPKQSYRAVKGGGYTDPRVTAWQNEVTRHAVNAMQDAAKMAGEVIVHIDFFRSTRARVDLDNLSKGVLDGAKGIVFGDDSAVIELHLRKFIDREHPGCKVSVREA